MLLKRKNKFLKLFNSNLKQNHLMPYTKADLEKIVYAQLENLHAMNDLLSIIKQQNELLEKANTKLKDEILEVKQKMYSSIKKERSNG